MCPCTPCTVSRPLKLPRRPILMVSPSSFSLDGSPTRHQSMVSLRSRSTSTTRRVPSTDGPSSSLVMRKAMVPWWPGYRSTNCSLAVTIAARPLFMSAAPRPYNMPILDHGHERVAAPFIERTRGHHIGVAGEAEHADRPARASPRSYRPARIAGSRRRSRWPEPLDHDGLASAVGRTHRGARDQLAG